MPRAPGQIFFGSLPCANPPREQPGSSQTSAAKKQRPPQGEFAQQQHQQQQQPAGCCYHGSISQLQELVQGCKRFPTAPHRPVLQWDFESRPRQSGSHLFRATVSFMLEGVPHHASGSWQPSKKLAQRDAADRALGLFAGAWGGGVWSIPTKRASPAQDPEEVINEFCKGLLPHWWACPALGNAADVEVQWKEMPYQATTPQAQDGYRSYVEITIFGVPHLLGGTTCSTPEAARRETARRVLWYLQCPGFGADFIPGLLPEEEPRIPLPPPQYLSLGATRAEGQLSEPIEHRMSGFKAVLPEDGGRTTASSGQRGSRSNQTEEFGVRPNLIMGTGHRRSGSPHRPKYGQVYYGSPFAAAKRNQNMPQADPALNEAYAGASMFKDERKISHRPESHVESNAIGA